MKREEQLASLTAERYASESWWTRRCAEPKQPRPAPASGDDDVTTARRRRLLRTEMAAFEAAQHHDGSTEVS